MQKSISIVLATIVVAITPLIMNAGPGRQNSLPFRPSYQNPPASQPINVSTSQRMNDPEDTSGICIIEITTDFGVMTAQLYDATPKHRDNFVKLAEEGFFDSLLFHRVISGFMIQGGDPLSKNAAPGASLGSGGPGYQVPAEFVDELVHVRGAIAAARTGDQVNPQRQSSGSQFYIVHGSPVDDKTLDMLESRKGFAYTPEQRAAYKEHGGTPFLDRDYTVFGQVLTGFDVLDKVAQVQKDGRDRPLQDVRMSIKVIR